MYALTIGYQEYLFHTVAQAAKAMELFESATKVESTWDEVKKESLYYKTPLELRIAKWNKQVLPSYEDAKAVCAKHKELLDAAKLNDVIASE
jgi:hypothetical protein